MTAKLRRVLLVDDNPSDIYLHSRVLKMAGCAEVIDTCGNGVEALEYLQRGDRGQPPRPELIFLDINMPRMNGWEFLDAYRELPADLRSSVVVVMLTVSPNPSDAERAASLAVISQYLNKPLTLDALHAVLSRHFPHAVG